MNLLVEYESRIHDLAREGVFTTLVPSRSRSMRHGAPGSAGFERTQWQPDLAAGTRLAIFKVVSLIATLFFQTFEKCSKINPEVPKSLKRIRAEHLSLAKAVKDLA
jgi:hypothetical protein